MTAVSREARELLIRTRSTGFSGVDAVATVVLPPVDGLSDRPVVYELGALRTLSYSTYHNKEAVRAVGFKNPLAWARGTKTIAGTMIFYQLYTQPIDDAGPISIIEDAGGMLSYSSGSVDYVRNSEFSYEPPLTQEANTAGVVSSSAINRRHVYDFSWDSRPMGRLLHATDLPPFDIIVTTVNELGNVGKMIIYGVDLVSEEGVLSVEDIYTEVRYSYMARDVEMFYAESWKEAESWKSQTMLNDFNDIASHLQVGDTRHRAMNSLRASSGQGVMVDTSRGSGQ